MGRVTTSPKWTLQSTNKADVSTWFMCQEEMAVRVEKKDTESGSLERIYDCTLAQELVLAKIS